MKLSQSASIQVVRVQGDGKILAAGFAYRSSSHSDFALVRYNANGSLDTTFGTNGTGMVFNDFGEQSQINAMQIQGDGEIVVAGFVANTNSTSGFALARYTTHGVLDASFGSGGTSVTPSPNDYTRANAMMIQGDGKFVAVGTGIASGDGGVDMAMFRYTTNGVLDSTFGGGTGMVFTRISPTSFGYSDSANAVATQFGNGTILNPDRIVVAGSYENENVFPSQFYLAVMRYNWDGTLDTSFGSGGIVTNLLSTWFSLPVGMAVQGFASQPRKITVGGYVNDFTNTYFFVHRFTASGALDTTFGPQSSGTVTLPLGRAAEVEAAAAAMTLQSGEIVVAGYRGIYEEEFDFAAARFTSSGLVDTNFGTNGLLLASVSDGPSQANAVALQKDGKVVVAGFAQSGQYHAHTHFALVRFNADGSLDPSFGSTGKLTTTFTTNDQAHALAVQSDGKIIAAGSSYGLFALARYNPDGSLDSSFGANGTTTTLVGTGGNQINAVRIQADGKIIAAGSATDATGTHFALARFNTNGTLDTTFGSAGKVITSISTADLAYGAAIQNNGTIVLAGLTASIGSSTLTANFAATRYNTNGAADFSFGSLGRAQENVGGGTLDVGYAMALQPDGKIVVAGGAGLGNIPGPVNANSSVNSFVALVRFNTNGTPDTTFGTSGAVITEVGAYSDCATSLALLPDGKMLVAGASQNGLYKFFALRYNADGSVDNSYGTVGAAFVDFDTGTNEYAYAMALDSSGRAVLAGDAGGLFGVARLQGDAVASPSLEIFLTATNAVVVSWPYPFPDWNLQENTNLISAPWTTPSQTINNDGTNNFIIIAPTAENRFYRLHGP